ncbi:ADP-ribose 1''-phosphate phosphatase [Penicillium subrubescens]|uniref:ADP-ribose 1''-phosphate phosphatase n=2 Tax=Penicillium subrubescens TaxID=1316194 RepID=A0A1Q5TC18_9EURO|nr:ADP-ribose 1''-phosphate phosphatase [Penicillium subrubescens]
MEGEAHTTYHAGGTTFMVPASPHSLIREVTGDLFDAPEGSGLIHACNTEGSWGAGIAQAFKERYPAAYRIYQSHCRGYARSKEPVEIVSAFPVPHGAQTVFYLPLGTALVIPPQPEDYNLGSKKHWIICLFTSRGFGRRVDLPNTILNSTRVALRDLKDKLLDLLIDGTEPSPTALYSCQFNSGLFRVPWLRTQRLVESVGLRVTVVIPPTET